MKKILFALLVFVLSFGGGQLTAADASSSKDRMKQEFQAFLNVFCKEHYHSCFSGRTYVENSVEVSDVSHPTSSSIRVDGTHSYRGRFGVLYSAYQFYAIIKQKGAGFEVQFYKRSAPDLFHDDYYWESCTKTITE